MKSNLKIMLLFGSMAIYGWVAYVRDKNTCAKTLAEMKEGLTHEGGRICRTLRYKCG